MIIKKNTTIKSLVLMNLFFLVSCGSHEANKDSGQIVAKVNDEEISIHQLNFLLSNASGINQEKLEPAKKQLLNSLIEQSLLFQQATAQKLDRDPQIMMAIEQAKRQMLAKAWLERTTSNIVKPSQQEIDEYYDSHPDLFAKHKTFKIKEVIINQSAGKENQVQQALNENKQLDGLLKKLEEDGIKFQAKESVQQAENLPLEQLPRLSALKEGEYISVDKEGMTWVASVLNFKEETVDKTKARSIIEAFLVNQQRKLLIEKTIKDLKEKAKIEYVGKFSELNSNDATTKAAPVQEAPKSEGSNTSEDLMSKGIKGL